MVPRLRPRVDGSVEHEMLHVDCLGLSHVGERIIRADAERYGTSLANSKGHEAFLANARSYKTFLVKSQRYKTFLVNFPYFYC